MYLRNQVRNDLNLRKLLRALHHRFETRRELGQQLVQVESQVLWPILLQIAAAGEEEFFRSADIAIAEVMKADGDLDEPLVKVPIGAAVFGPNFFPGIVSFM